MLKRYKMTGRGSVTRWEFPEGHPQAGQPCRGQPPGEAVLRRYQADQRHEILLEPEYAEKHPEMGLIPILDRARIEVRSEPEAVTIEADGNVSLMSPAPAAKLDVEGHRGRKPRAPKAAHEVKG